MLNTDLNILLNQKDLNDTYLDLLCNEIVFNKPYRLLKFKWADLSNKKACRFLMIIAKHGLREYIRPITAERLIQKKGGTKLIDELLDIDTELTINNIIPTRILEDISVALHLRLRGLEQDNVNVTLYSKDMARDYARKANSQFEHLPLDVRSQGYIRELRNIMTKDGKSNPELIDLMITSYEFLLFVNPEIGQQEIRKIIELKRTDQRFSIVEANKGRSEYIAKNNTIYMQEPFLPVFNHEMGHFFFANLTNKKVPSEFYEIIEKLKNSEGFLDKVQEYGRKMRELVFSIQDMVEEKYMPSYDRSITEKEKERIGKLIETQKDEIRSKYLKAKNDPKKVEEMLDKSFSVEEYLNQERRIQKNRLVVAILRYDFGAFRAIGDMLDAIYGGALFSNELLYRDGVPALRATGHGIAYYRSRATNIFEESLSQFLLIIKSVDSKEVIAYMHDLFGDNYLNFFFNYYLNQILSMEETKQVIQGRNI